MDVVIVGAGRLGRSLHLLLPAAGVPTRLVGRGAPVPSDTDTILLCVPDSAVASVAAITPAGPVLLHCSGALDLEPLRPRSPVGSLHPLMTFPGPELGLPVLTGVPAAVAGDPEAVAVARALARRLGLVPFEVPGDRRLYHAAAVIAGNFATVLLGEAARVLEAAGVPPDQAVGALIPLAEQSVRNARQGAARALTGPVARGDEETLDRHRRALDEHGLHEIRELYDRLVAAARLQRSTHPFGEGDPR